MNMTLIEDFLSKKIIKPVFFSFTPDKSVNATLEIYSYIVYYISIE